METEVNSFLVDMHMDTSGTWLYLTKILYASLGTKRNPSKQLGNTPKSKEK